MTSCISEVVCVSCGNVPTPGREMTCPECGPDEGILEICFDLDRVRAARRPSPSPAARSIIGVTASCCRSMPPPFRSAGPSAGRRSSISPASPASSASPQIPA